MLEPHVEVDHPKDTVVDMPCNGIGPVQWNRELGSGKRLKRSGEQGYKRLRSRSPRLLQSMESREVLK